MRCVCVCVCECLFQRLGSLAVVMGPMELKARDEPGDKGWIKERMALCTLPKELCTDWLRVTACVYACVCVSACVCMYPCRCEQLSDFLSGPIRRREFGPHV